MYIKLIKMVEIGTSFHFSRMYQSTTNEIKILNNWACCECSYLSCIWLLFQPAGGKKLTPFVRNLNPLLLIQTFEFQAEISTLVTYIVKIHLGYLIRVYVSQKSKIFRAESPRILVSLRCQLNLKQFKT